MTDKQYDDTNKGALFTNAEKQSDSHPDYKGSINVGGTDYWISGWKKTSKKGANYLSLSVTVKERKDVSSTVPDKGQRAGGSRPSATDARVNQQLDNDQFEDDIPW